MNQYPFDAIDLVLMLLAPSHPVWLGVCILQYVFRRSPYALAALQRVGIDTTDTPLLAELLPGGAATASPPEAPGSEPVVAAQPLLPVLHDQLHLLVIGHTQGGKTSLMHQLATHHAQQGMRVLVCDPDAAPGLWPGCRVVGHGDNWEAIGLGLALTRKELKQRRKARAAGQRRFPPIGVVLDEYQDIARQVPHARDLVEDIARRGGKLNIRLTVGVQDKQVSTLGLQGKGDLRRNFTTVDVMRQGDGRRVALVDSHGEQCQYQIPQLPNLDKLITQPPPAAPVHAGDQAMLSALLTGSGTGSGTGTMAGSGTGSSAGTPDTTAVDNTTSAGTGSGDLVLADTDAQNDLTERIRRMLAVPMTANEICKAVGGNRADVLSRIKTLKG